MYSKKCKRCARILSVDEFRPYIINGIHARYVASGNLRYHHQCRKCEVYAAREYRKNNPEKYKASNKKYRQSHKDQRNEYNRRWREENHDAALAAQRSWRERFPDRQKESTETWRNNNRDHYLNQKKKAKKTPEGLKKTREHRKRNIDKFRDYARNRRARIKSAKGTFSEKEFNLLCAKFNNQCLCCGRKTNLTADHIVPISRGGVNSIDNIQPLCQSCNSKKKTRIIDYRDNAS